MFLIAEQSIHYYKPIAPFSKYIVRSEIKVDEKWINYEHYFENQHSRKLHAHIKMRAVIKKPSGQTVKPSEVEQKCPGFKDWLVRHDQPSP